MSPSMNVSLISVSLSSLPRAVRELYVDYLWDYRPQSWVAKSAYACRVLALVLLFPIIVLMLLDIASYAIARTLGVVEDTKASTTDTTEPASDAPTPPVITTTSPQSPPRRQFSSSSLNIPDGLPPSSSSSSSFFQPGESTVPDGFAEPEHHHHHHHHHHHLVPPRLSPSAGPPEYFTSEADTNLKLSGVGVFSPASSEPSSPVIGRKQLAMSAMPVAGAASAAGAGGEGGGHGSTSGSEDESVYLRRRLKSVNEKQQRGEVRL